MDIYGDYNPRGETETILDRAWDLVQGVPYKVSARWVFYRLLQEGFYSKKSDYKNKWIKTSSAARHAFYKGWRPDTLADETRQADVRGLEDDLSADKWIEETLDFVITNRDYWCKLDKWEAQPVYLELWYEARAMTDQFRHYTEYITLVPMGGQPSIPYKWETAKRLEKMWSRYEKPIVVLYFGDLDPAGETISEVVKRDVRKWCAVDFEFVHCGLTADQVAQYNVIENPDKPGQFQWEAISDQAAKEIIENGTSQYLRHGAFSEVIEAERAASEELATRLDAIFSQAGL